MAEFTASPDVSGFTPPNQLFNYANAVGAAQGLQSNQLGIQGKQIDLANANMAQVGQAAAGLLSAYPDEASRAAAYPKVVGMLQSQGVAMNAPQTYPGEGALRAIVNASIPAKDLYSSGALMTPAQQALLGGGNTGTTTTAAPGSTTGAAAPATGGPAPFVGANLPQGVTPDEDQLVRTVYGEARGEPVAGQQAVASVIKTRMRLGNQGVGDVVFAPNQFEAWSDPKNRPGMEALSPTDPQYQAILNKVVRPVMSGQAQDPTGGATNFYNPTLQAQLGRSTPGFAQGNQTTIGNHTFFYGGYAPRGTTTASAAPTTAQPGQPVPTQVASNTPMVSTAPPGSTAAPGGPPAAPSGDLMGPRALPRIGPGSPVVTPQSLANTPVPQNGPAPPPAPGQPAQAQPAQPQAAPAAPASTSRLPDVSTIPTGQNSAPYKQAQAMIQEAMRYDAVAGTNPAFAKRAADLRANAAQVLQAGATVSAQQNGREGELEVVTGKFTPYQALPSPRFTGGAAVYNKTTGGWDQPTPATQADAVEGHWGVSGSGAPQFFPDATVPAEGGYKNMETAYKRDSENITGIGAEGRTAQADQVRVQEMRNILKTVNTGSAAETQAAIQAFLQKNAPSMFTNWTTNYANLDGPAAIQMFQKLGFMGATSQEQQTTPRGGYLATKLFQQFNPGAQLLTATNNGLLAQRLISNQASIDYTQGAQDHFGEQEQNFTSSKPSYSSLAQYDRQWQNQRNPQVYAAAIGALGQQDYAQWSKNLSQPEIERALDVVHRADPSAVVNGQNGRLDLSNKGQTSAPASSGTQAAPARIIHYDASGKRL